MLATAIVSETVADARAHYGKRIQDLTRVLEGAWAERGLAIYRAYQAGVPVEEIAHLALMKVPEVEGVLASCRRDPDIDNLPEGPDWIQFHRHHGGWRING